MDKRLVYDPNVDLSNYNKYQEPMGNYSQFQGNNMQNMQNMQSMQSMQMPQQNVPMQQQQLPPIYQMQQQVPPPAQQFTIQEPRKIEKMTASNNKKKPNKFKEICSMATLRKILVITILYVIISHNKTTLLLCSNVPYVCITNALSYNILKGIIFSIIIILSWYLM